jgi:sulfite reductase (NADPH) flavoprotein alpha-component
MITILYATMTGNSRECAEKAAAALTKAGLPVETHDLAKYNPRDFLKVTTLLLPISTWGEGEPPDDAVSLYDFVKDLEAPALAQLSYAIFALGDTSYDEFCKCGKDFDRMFEERGGRRLLECVENDVDFIDALDKWCVDIVPAVQGALPVS